MKAGQETREGKQCSSRGPWGQGQEEGSARGPTALLSAPPGGNCHNLLLGILGSKGCGV